MCNRTPDPCQPPRSLRSNGRIRADSRLVGAPAPDYLSLMASLIVRPDMTTRHDPRRRHRILVLVALAWIPQATADSSTPSTPPAASAATESTSKLRSPEDGWLDFSSFLDEAYGFLPIAMPITEPAVGYGVGGGVMFLDEAVGKAAAEYKRPNISGVFGFGTENGTWGGGVGDMRNWMDGRLQTLAAGFTASVHLDFYGIGDDPVLADRPLRYELEPLGGVVQGKYQLGDSRFFAGIGYVYVAMDVRFEAPENTPGLPDYASESTVGGLLPSLSYDTRDNIFTPTKGLYAEATLATFAEALGADDDYQRGTLLAMYFRPLGEKVYLGLKGQATAAWSDPPFYLLPYVQLRGAPAMRYQGERVVQAEAELRWQFYKRFSFVGFAGTGLAQADIQGVERDRSVVTGGTGFRYELARKYGIHAGIDVAWGPDNTAFYIQVGSAWMRP